MYTDLQYLESFSLRHPDTRALYEYWLSKRGERLMPRRRDIDAVEIPPRLLPGISIVEAVTDSRRYIYRLIGTAEVQVRGYDPTGRSVREAFFAPEENDALACYDKVVATKVALVDPAPFETDESPYVTDETIYLPLSDDGVSVDKIVVYSVTRHFRTLSRIGT